MPKELYVINEFIIKNYMDLDESIRESVRRHGKISPLDLVVDSSITVGELIEAHGLTTFDYSLPQTWVDDVREKTGINPVGKVVWNYEENKCGQPFGLTREGVQLISIYNYILDHMSMVEKEYKDALYKIRGIVADCL